MTEHDMKELHDITVQELIGLPQFMQAKAWRHAFFLCTMWKKIDQPGRIDSIRSLCQGFRDRDQAHRDNRAKYMTGEQTT